MQTPSKQRSYEIAEAAVKSIILVGDTLAISLCDREKRHTVINKHTPASKHTMDQQVLCHSRVPFAADLGNIHTKAFTE